MTKLELEQFVTELLGKEQVDVNAFYTPDELLRALNKAQQDVSQDLRIPRRLLVVETPSPFDMPTEARGGGLISIVDDETQQQLRIMSVEEANRNYPGWQTWEVDYEPPRFVVYDPGNITATVTAVPKHTTPRKYYIHYAIRPGDLVADTDVPFNNDPDLTDLHPLVAYKAAAYLFETDKTADGVHQANRMLQHYQVEKARLASRVLRTEQIRVRNRYWRSFFGGG